MWSCVMLFFGLQEGRAHVLAHPTGITIIAQSLKTNNPKIKVLGELEGMGWGGVDVALYYLLGEGWGQGVLLRGVVRGKGEGSRGRRGRWPGRKLRCKLHDITNCTHYKHTEMFVCM